MVVPKVVQIQAQLALLLHRWEGFQDTGSEQEGYLSVHMRVPPPPEAILEIVGAIGADRVAT